MHSVHTRTLTYSLINELSFDSTSNSATLFGFTRCYDRHAGVDLAISRRHESPSNRSLPLALSIIGKRGCNRLRFVKAITMDRWKERNSLHQRLPFLSQNSRDEWKHIERGKSRLHLVLHNEDGHLTPMSTSFIQY